MPTCITSERLNGPDVLSFKARGLVVDAGGDPGFSSGGSGAGTDARETFRESVAMDSDIINAEVCSLLAWRNPRSASVLVAGGSSCASSCALEAQEEGTGLLVCSAVGGGTADGVGGVFSPSEATGRCVRARCVRMGKGVGRGTSAGMGAVVRNMARKLLFNRVFIPDQVSSPGSPAQRHASDTTSS